MNGISEYSRTKLNSLKGNLTLETENDIANKLVELIPEKIIDSLVNLDKDSSLKSELTKLSSNPNNSLDSENFETNISANLNTTAKFIKLCDSDEEILKFAENQAVKDIWRNLFQKNPEISSETNIEDLIGTEPESNFAKKVYKLLKTNLMKLKKLSYLKIII